LEFLSKIEIISFCRTGALPPSTDPKNKLGFKKKVDSNSHRNVEKAPKPGQVTACSGLQTPAPETIVGQPSQIQQDILTL